MKVLIQHGLIACDPSMLDQYRVVHIHVHFDCSMTSFSYNLINVRYTIKCQILEQGRITVQGENVKNTAIIMVVKQTNSS